jgi:hypothetical protein
MMQQRGGGQRAGHAVHSPPAPPLTHSAHGPPGPRHDARRPAGFRHIPVSKQVPSSGPFGLRTRVAVVTLTSADVSSWTPLNGWSLAS